MLLVNVAEVAPVGAGAVVVAVVVVVAGVVAGVGVATATVTVLTGSVVVVAAVVAAVSTQHFFHWPTAGSPNVALSHDAEFVKSSTTLAAATPYLTLRLPANEQVSSSCAHSVQTGLTAVAVEVTVAATGVVTGVLAIAPPPSEVAAEVEP